MDPITLPTSADPRVSVLVLSRQDPAMLGRCLASIAASTAAGGTPYELLLVLNGAAPDVAPFVQRGLRGARVVDSSVNLGFGGGNIYAASLARGEYLLLLNDDTEVTSGWLDALVATLDGHPEAGAVGSRILFPDGRLQEAGSLVFRDGSTTPVGRFDPPGTWLARRRTDYVSFCSTLIRRTAWEAVGGLDPAYFPAYYEDVDFCLALRDRGLAVLYEPASVVRHMESQSTGWHFKEFLFRRNHKRLTAKWAPALARQLAPPADGDLAPAIQHARGNPTRVLLVDDRLPGPSMGAGFGRTYELLRRLDDPAYAVTVYATQDPAGDPTVLGALGIDALTMPVDEFREWLVAQSVPFEHVIVSRPDNWGQLADDLRRTQPDASLIYDAEALFHVRSERHAALATGAARDESLRVAARMRAIEERIAREADALVTVSPDEEKSLRAMGAAGPIFTIPPVQADIEPTPASFAERRDLLYVASWIAGPESPNVDGLRWLHEEVLPLIRAAVPWFRLLVTGDGVPTELRTLAGANLAFIGFVPNVATAYGTARAVVSPMRFGAGVKIKTVEALQHGVPVVATTVGAEAVPLRRGDEIDVADDPAEFAARCVRLLTDETYWAERRAAVVALRELWRGEGGGSWSDVLDEPQPDDTAGAMIGRTAELEATLRERMAELQLLHEQVAALRADLAVKDEYVAELQQLHGIVRPPGDTLNVVGYRVVDKTAAVVRRMPWLLRALRRIGRLVRRRG
jgi:GT2 family glycosyltransferase